MKLLSSEILDKYDFLKTYARVKEYMSKFEDDYYRYISILPPSITSHLSDVKVQTSYSNTSPIEAYIIKKSEKEKLAIKKQQRKDRKKRLAVKKQNESIQLDCDDTFALIVGYTSGGVPYGTTWEQMGVDPELPYEEKVKSLFGGEFWCWVNRIQEQ